MQENHARTKMILVHQRILGVNFKWIAPSIFTGKSQLKCWRKKPFTQGVSRDILTPQKTNRPSTNCKTKQEQFQTSLQKWIHCFQNAAENWNFRLCCILLLRQFFSWLCQKLISIDTVAKTSPLILLDQREENFHSAEQIQFSSQSRLFARQMQTMLSVSSTIHQKVIKTECKVENRGDLHTTRTQRPVIHPDQNRSRGYTHADQRPELLPSLRT